MPRGNRRTRDLRRLATRVQAQVRPISLQARMRTVPGTSGGTPTEFQFPFAPIQISYENLAPELVEIERPQNLPYVDRRSYKLLRVSLQFLLAKPFDGFNESVDPDIRILRSMANSNDPVMFVNLDGMLTNPFNIPQLGANRTNAAFFFRIAELSVQSVRRNTKNEISAAEVSLTIVEDANTRATVINFPPITYPDLVKPATKSTGKSKGSNALDTYAQTLIDMTKAGKANPVFIIPPT